MTTKTSPFRELFDQLEIPTPDAINEGTTASVLTADQMGDFARVAMMRWVVPGSAEFERLTEAHFVPALASCLTNACSCDSPYVVDDVPGDDYPWLEFPNGFKTRITEDLLISWHWMLSLLCDEELARRFLGQIPRKIHDDAMATALSPDRTDKDEMLTTGIAFQEIVNHF